MSKTTAKRCVVSLMLGATLALILVNTLQAATGPYAVQKEPIAKPTSKNVSGSETQGYGERGAGIVEQKAVSRDTLSAVSTMLEPIALGLAAGLTAYFLARLLTR